MKCNECGKDIKDGDWFQLITEGKIEQRQTDTKTKFYCVDHKLIYSVQDVDIK